MASDNKAKLNEDNLNKREARIKARQEKLDRIEAELAEREKAIKARDAKRKQIILRLPETLWRDIVAWAEDDFRSVNGQIEYLLTQSVRERRK